MSKSRESSFDLLRILAALAVVVLHVSASFLQVNETGTPANCTFFLIFLNHIVRFAVPCFLMLSGAFNLSDERNADYRYFYKKAVNNIGLTSALFCMLYVLYDILKLIVRTFILHKNSVDGFALCISDSLLALLRGRPYYHLWYLFILIGLYLATPFIIRLSADLRGGVNLYGKITTVFLALASASYITSKHFLMWDIGWQFCFLSYILMGYRLRQWGKERKNNRLALLFIMAGFVVNVALAYVNYIRGTNGLQIDTSYVMDNPFSYGPLAPIEVIASCLIFAGFSVLDIKKNFSWLARYTFLIYLIHAGVWDVLSIFTRDILFENQIIEAMWVVVISLLVFFASLLGAVVFNKLNLFEKIEQNN